MPATVGRFSHHDNLAIGLQGHAIAAVNASAEVRGHLARAVEGCVQRAVGIVARHRKISIRSLPGHHDFTIALQGHVVAVVIAAAKRRRHDSPIPKAHVQIAGGRHQPGRQSDPGREEQQCLEVRVHRHDEGGRGTLIGDHRNQRVEACHAAFLPGIYACSPEHEGSTE